MAIAVSATDRSTSAGTTVASCSENSGVAFRTMACTWPPDRLPDNQHSAVIGRVCSFFAVAVIDLALLDVMPAWVPQPCRHRGGAVELPQRPGVELADHLRDLRSQQVNELQG